jgi:hypothetical protein
MPFVCDFGLAMALDEPALTFTHAVVGTPAYMAPEQLHGKRDQISAATDVYALGGTLYFALTGRPPGLAGAKASSIRDPGIPRDLRVIIAKCLEPDPELRYPMASALAEDLWRFREGAPIRASDTPGLIRFGLRAAKPLKPWLLLLVGAALTGAVWMGRQGQSRAADRQQMELAQRFLLEAGELAREFHQELMLPVHDLRPSYARIRSRMEQVRPRLEAMAPAWRSQGHFVLGSASGLIRDYATAKAELDQAWNSGLHDPQVASLLAAADIAVARSAEEAGQFAQGPPAAGNGIEASNLRLALGQDSDASLGALLAFQEQDYLKGAANSHATFLAAPWHWEAATVESACLRALGRRELEAGNLAKARTRYQEAVAAARAGLAVGQSDPTLYHAYYLAARSLAALSLEWGEPPGAFLAECLASSDRALRLDPTDPDLQDDWVAFRWLDARRLMQLGEDPEPALGAARAFMDTWAREPLTVRLRTDRMLVYWMLAEQELHRGGDPDPALTEALKTSGHTPFLYRDYLWELLNFKARVDAARGADPRPILDAALERLQPMQQGAPRSLKETLAGSWLIRAEWEAAHGLDSGLSIHNARSLAESARNQSPESASAYALEGLGQVLELKAFPKERPMLLPRAQECLKLAQARNPGGQHQDRLRRALLELRR